MRGWFRQATGGLPRQFWFLWLGTLINRLGAFVIIFLAIYLTGERHFSQSRAGLVIGLYGVGGAIGTTVGGVLADRWGRRPTLLTAQFGAAALMLALGFAQTYPAILAVTLVLGAFSESARPAFQAMMVDIVPERDRIRAYSLNYWAINLGFALSAVGAGLAAKADYLLLFVVDAGTTLITAVIGLCFLAETRPVRRAAGPRQAGLGAVLRDRFFMGYLAISIGSIVVIMQHMSTLPIAMTQQGFSSATYGVVIAVNGVLIVAGQLFVPKIVEGREPARVLALAAIITGAGFGLVAFAGSALFFAFTVVIWTLGEMLQAPSNANTIASLSPIELRGRYQGVSSLNWAAGTALAPILGGLTQEHLGNKALWIGCFAVCAVIAVGHLLSAPARRRRAALVAANAATVAETAASMDEPEAVAPSLLPPAVAAPLADDPTPAR